MNEQNIKARYRNKVGKIIIEVFNGEKWIYVKTLSDPLKEFKQECLAKVSFSTGENIQNSVQKCEQSLLSEPTNKDTSENIHEIAKNELNKLMNDVL